MGPEAARIVSECGAPELNELGYFKVGPAHIAGKHVRAARLSYVGEAGWEITMKAKNAAAIYAALASVGAKPAGLYAQTSMRIEKGFCAMGHELDSDVTPIDVGLDFATRKAGGFIGDEALAERRKKRGSLFLVSLKFHDETAIPLGHEPIYYDDKIIGKISSCAFGYRIGKPVALGAVRHHAASGIVVQVDIARQFFDATLVTHPLYDPEGIRMKSYE